MDVISKICTLTNPALTIKPCVICDLCSRYYYKLYKSIFHLCTVENLFIDIIGLFVVLYYDTDRRASTYLVT